MIGDNTMMLLTLLLYICACQAEYVAKCSNETKKLTFENSEDGVGGRYTVQWCTKLDVNITAWETVIRVGKNLNCAKQFPPRDIHSSIKEPIHPEIYKANCSIVCLSLNFDLIFSSCYYIDSHLVKGIQNLVPSNTYHNISNNYTQKFFSDTDTRTNVQSHGEVMVVNWYLGYIPVTSYTVELCTPNHTEADKCQWVEESNCTLAEVNSVQCELVVPYGCYKLVFAHEAPWKSGVFGSRSVHKYYCHRAADVAVAPGGGGGGGRATRTVWWGWAGGAAVATGALVAALCWLRDTRLARKVREAVRQAWIQRSDVGPDAAGDARDEKGGGGGGGRMVLLYSRGCPLAAALLPALADRMRRAGLQVVDIHSAETVALSAGSPSRWVRSVLTAGDTRALLLQTPALRASLAVHVDDTVQVAERPLLCESPPAFGDSLLQFAWRVLLDTAPDAALVYRKYYVATVAHHETELAGGVCPYRRYVLPDATAALLADLAVP